MSATDKPLVTAADGKIAPQYYNPTTDQYQHVQGKNGGSNVNVIESVLPPGAATDAKLDLVLAKLGDVEAEIEAIKSTDGIKKIADGVQLTGSNVPDEEPLPTKVVGGKMQRRTIITQELILNAGQSAVILDNYEFPQNVTAWALFGYGFSRNASMIVNGLTLLIEQTNGNYSEAGGSNLVFKQYVRFAEEEDVFNKGLVISSDPNIDTRTSLIVAGKYFNIPAAKYMRLTLFNNLATSDMRFAPLSFVEEGVF